MEMYEKVMESMGSYGGVWEVMRRYEKILEGMGRY